MVKKVIKGMGSFREARGNRRTKGTPESLLFTGSDLSRAPERSVIISDKRRERMRARVRWACYKQNCIIISC